VKAPLAEPTQVDPTSGSLLPLRILVTEDSVTIQKVVLRMLASLGFTADTATSGAAALMALHECPYDLVLMDMQMPEMDGLTATRAIRSMADVEQPQIVAMTANDLPADRAECVAAGMDDYLSKPFQMPDLEAVLSRCRAAHTLHLPDVE
jgi:CheY-like chemotaxis protein